MKRQLPLFFTICIFFSSYTFSQNILPAPELHPKWTVCSFNVSLERDTVMYQFGGQLSLCDTLWQEVEEIRPNESIKTRGYYTESTDGLKGFFKFETSCEAPSYTIYDFDVEPGDTIQYPVGAWDSNLPRFNDLLFYGVFTIGGLEFYSFQVLPGFFAAPAEIYWRIGSGASRHPFPIFLSLIHI